MELRFIAAALRRAWWLVLALVLIGAGLGAALAWRVEPAGYTSEALVRVETPSGVSVSPDRLVADELASMGSSGVVDEVAKTSHMSPIAVRSRVQVSARAGADVLVIRGQGSSPEGAQRLVESYTDAAVVNAEQRVHDATSPQLGSVDEQLETLQAEISQASDQISSAVISYIAKNQRNAQIPTADVLAPRASAKLALAQSQIDALLVVKGDLTRRAAYEPLSVIQTASSPSEHAPRTLPFLLAGALIGLTLAMALALILYEFSRFIADDARAADALGIDVDGSLRLPRPAALGPTLLAWADVPVDAPTVAGLVGGALAVAQPDSGPRILVTSAGHDPEMVAALCLRLGAYLARRGDAVVMVDAQDHDSYLTRMFEDDARQPAADTSVGSEGAWSFVPVATDLQGLSVLARRPGRVLNRADLAFLSSQALGAGEGSASPVGAGGPRRSRVEASPGRSPGVLIAAGSLTTEPFVLELAATADFVLVVLGPKPRRSDLARAAAAIDRSGKPAAAVRVSLARRWRTPKRTTPSGRRAERDRDS